MSNQYKGYNLMLLSLDETGPAYAVFYNPALTKPEPLDTVARASWETNSSGLINQGVYPVVNDVYPML